MRMWRVNPNDPNAAWLLLLCSGIGCATFGGIASRIADLRPLKCARLSAHERGSQERDLEKFDCSKSWLGRQFAFWRYIDTFDRQFEAAAR